MRGVAHERVDLIPTQHDAETGRQNNELRDALPERKEGAAFSPSFCADIRPAEMRSSFS